MGDTVVFILTPSFIFQHYLYIIGLGGKRHIIRPLVAGTASPVELAV